jgi:protein-disulfide isomerase
MKRYLPFVIVVVVALATLGSGTILYRAKRPQLHNIPESQSVSAKDDKQSAHIRGNPDAPVTLEEFGDFQCPPCGQFAGFVEELRREYDSRLRVVFRNFPLPAHEHAREAAQAAEAAGLQSKFWEMYDTLYREQSLWSNASNARELFESYAGTLGLDVDQFKKDMDGDKVRERIDSDHALADFLGVKVTPTLFINNRAIDPKDKNPEGVRAAINAALEEKSKNGT